MNKIPPITLGGITYTAEQILSAMQPVRDIHDTLIDQGHIYHAATMNDVLNLMQHLAKHTE